MPVISALRFARLLLSSVHQADKPELREAYCRTGPSLPLPGGRAPGTLPPRGAGPGAGVTAGAQEGPGVPGGAAPSRPHKAAFSSRPSAPAEPVIVFDKTSLASAAAAAAAPRSRCL